MLEFAKTIPANCKTTKEEIYATEQGVQASSEHTQKKSRFGLTNGAGQCFIFWNGMCGKATGRVRSPSRPVT